jgi:hypothetical protein
MEKIDKIDNILVRNGCVAWCRDVNGIDVEDIEDKRATIMKIAELIPEDYIGEFVEWFAETFYSIYGTYEMDDEPCECCGDYVEEYNLKF